MSCNNCFNGCAEIISDQCIKYTGLAIPELGINNGDTLSSVELAVTTYLVNALDGSGIYPLVDPLIICNVISKYFAECAGCDGLSLNELLTAMVKAICDLQVQINLTNTTIAAIEGPYNVNCLSGVVSDSGIHTILQTTIDLLCAVDTSLTGVINSLTTYVTADNIDSYIAAYLATNPATILINSRMVPWGVVEYYGPLSGPNSPNFDSTGAGTGDWDRIFLCNGQNGTPDKRGVVGIGTTDGSMGGLAMPARTNPSNPNNPTYALSIPQGENVVTLNPTQIPSHAHANTVTITIAQTPHSHAGTAAGPFIGTNLAGNPGFDGGGFIWKERPITLEPSSVNLTATGVMNNAEFGSGQAHPNIQPVLPCYYIQYRPF